MSFNPHWHIVFDFLAFLAGSAFFKRELNRTFAVSRIQESRGYWVCLVLGAVGGAYFAGSLNLSLVGILRIGHSIAGALTGGIVAIELFKYKKGIKVSTGSIFVFPLMAGIVLGRLGCFFSGLSDETYGTATTLPWAINLGDGIPRHPVPLYESLTVLVSLLALMYWRRRHESQFQSLGFYLFILIYSFQRFVWEFFKPYPALIGRFNLFHALCLIMLVYASVMIFKVTYAKPRHRN
jgi:prolipoprotein diacylglyceryltransferase